MTMSIDLSLSTLGACIKTKEKKMTMNIGSSLSSLGAQKQMEKKQQ
jgi:hypothetical protein